MSPLYDRDVRDLIESTRSYYAALRKRDVDELEYSKCLCDLLVRPRDSMSVCQSSNPKNPALQELSPMLPT